MKDLFCEIIKIKNPSSSLERKKIVELANEQMNHRFDEIFYEKNNNLKVRNKEDNNDENNDSNYDKKIIISKIIGVEKLRIDDRLIDEISDTLSGLASYSLFIEANRLLQIIASKMIINRQNEINNSQLKDISSRDNDNKINANLREKVNVNELKNENEENENNYNNKDNNENKNKSIEVNNKIEIKNEVKNVKNDKWNLSFPCVYGQAYGKQVLLEALLWPRKYSSLYRSLSPRGMRYSRICFCFDTDIDIDINIDNDIIIIIVIVTVIVIVIVTVTIIIIIIIIIIISILIVIDIDIDIDIVIVIIIVFIIVIIFIIAIAIAIVIVIVIIIVITTISILLDIDIDIVID